MPEEKITLETIHEILIRVESQVNKTNGRVSKLEIWRGFITGGLAILAILVIPLILNYFAL